MDSVVIYYLHTPTDIESHVLGRGFLGMNRMVISPCFHIRVLQCKTAIKSANNVKRSVKYMSGLARGHRQLSRKPIQSRIIAVATEFVFC